MKFYCLALRRSALITFKKFLSIYILFGLFVYLLNCDVERNPGPPLTYVNFLSENKKLKDPLCFYQLNCRSLVNKREQLKKMLRECSNNTLFAFTETWLTNEDNINLWCIDSDYYSCFRCDRISKISKWGGVMLLIPKIFNPKTVMIFQKLAKTSTLWIELTLPYKKFSPLLVNVSYNPEKSKTDIFLEELALQIDYEITKKQKKNYYLAISI